MARGPRSPRLDFTGHEYIGAPVGGWSPDVPSWMLPADQAAVLENFIVRPGKIRVRPSFKVTTDTQVAAKVTGGYLSVGGWIPWASSETLFTRRVPTTVGFDVEPQNLHRVLKSIPSGTAPAEDAIYAIGPGNTITRTAVSTTGAVPGFRSVRFNGKLYALSYAGYAGGGITFNDGILSWATEVLSVTSPTTTPTSMLGAPSGGFDLYGWLDRMWVFGGMQPGGTTGGTTTLFFTNPIAALTGTVTDWNDPVSGLYNQIVIDGNYLDCAVGLASVPAGLLLFRKNSLFILRGTDPTTYVIRPVSREFGCIDARSIVEMDNVVYWMSEQGLMVTNGTTVNNVSGPLQDELYRQIATWRNGVFSSTGAWCIMTSTSDNKLLVSFGTYSTPDASGYHPVGGLTALFDPATGVWVKLTSAINMNGGTNPGPLMSGSGSIWTLGPNVVVQIENSSSGSTLSSGPALWDVSSSSGTLVPITATWASRSFQAALGERSKIQLKRAYADYSGYTGSAAATVEMKLVDRESSGSALVDDTLPLSTAASGPRQRFERDVQPEVADLGVELTMAGGAGAASASVPTAEIHGAGIEFQPTSNMRPVN